MSEMVERYMFAILLFLASIGMALGMAAAFGGRWDGYLLGMMAFQVCLLVARGRAKGTDK